jgi:hypothetical protein
VRQPPWLAAGAQIIPALLVILAIFFIRGPERQRSEPPRHQGTKKDEAFEIGVGQSNLRVHVFLLGMSVGPLLLAWLYSLLVRPNYLVARYDLVAWPAFMVWLGVLLTDLPKPALRAAFLVLLLACSAVPLQRLLAADPPPSVHRLRAERITELTNEKDLVIAFSYDRDYLQYYLHRAGFKSTIRSFPTWLENQIGWVDTEADLRRLEGAKQDAAALAGSIARKVEAGGNVYILADSIDPQGAGPRAAISALLIEALEENRLGIEPADADYFIFRLRAL